jgi:hypothetical protein
MDASAYASAVDADARGGDAARVIGSDDVT